MRPFGGYVHGRLWAAAGAGWTPAKGPNLFSWMRGDDPDASINTTPDPDQYAAIPDRGMPLESFAQPTSGNQPQLSTDWTPSPVPFFADGRRFSAGGAPDAKMLHDGTSDCDLYGIAVVSSLSATHTVFRTMSSFNTSGALMHITSAGAIQVQCGNGSGDAALSMQTSAGAISAGAPFIWGYSKRGADVQLYLQGSVVGSGTISSPSSGDASGPFTLGATATGNNPLIGMIPEIIWFAGSSLPQRQVVENYLSRWSYTP